MQDKQKPVDYYAAFLSSIGQAQPQTEAASMSQSDADYAEFLTSTGQLNPQVSNLNPDGPAAYSFDVMQRMMGRGVQSVGELIGSDSVAGWGKDYVSKQDEEIAAGGYRPEYQGSFTEQDVTDMPGWVWEKVQENLASGTVGLGGTALALASAPFSAPLAAAFGGATIASTGLMGAGEVAQEFEDKGLESNPLLEVLGGGAIGALERFGAGKVLSPKVLSKLMGDELMMKLIKDGKKEAAKAYAKEVLKRTGYEVGTEVAQEGVSVGMAGASGAQYTPDELINRAIDTAVVTTPYGATFATPNAVSGVRKAMASEQKRAEDYYMVDPKTGEVSQKNEPTPPNAAPAAAPPSPAANGGYIDKQTGEIISRPNPNDLGTAMAQAAGVNASIQQPPVQGDFVQQDVTPNIGEFARAVRESQKAKPESIKEQPAAKPVKASTSTEGRAKRIEVLKNRIARDQKTLDAGRYKGRDLTDAESEQITKRIEQARTELDQQKELEPFGGFDESLQKSKEQWRDTYIKQPEDEGRWERGFRQGYLAGVYGKSEYEVDSSEYSPYWQAYESGLIAGRNVETESDGDVSTTAKTAIEKKKRETEQTLNDELDFIDKELYNWFTPKEIAQFQKDAPNNYDNKERLDWLGKKLVEGQKRGWPKGKETISEAQKQTESAKSDAQAISKTTPEPDTSAPIKSETKKPLTREGANFPELRKERPNALNSVDGSDVEDSRPSQEQDQESGNENSQKTLFSKPESDVDTGVTDLWQQLAMAEEIFQQPASRAKGLREIAADIDPGIQVERLDAPMHKQANTVTEWKLTMPDGKPAYLRENQDATIELNAALLVSGQSRGSALYNVAATYAHNNGKVFIGDRDGLSDEAFYRRTENMMSSALKFGTTKHLRPHPKQGIDWVPGDDKGNLTRLIQKHYANITEYFPAIKGIKYDFGRKAFINTESGQRFTEADFRATAGVTRGKGTPQAGARTLKRAALTNTLVQGAGKETRLQILGQLARQLRTQLDPALGEILYSKSSPTAKSPAKAGLSVSEVEKTIAPVILKWGDSAPTVEVVQSVNDIPPDIVDADEHPDGFEAVYYAPSGKIYLVADMLPTQDRTLKVLAHEAVGHHSFEEMMGDDLDTVLERVQWLKRDDKKIADIAKEVRRRYSRKEPETGRMAFTLSRSEEAREIVAVMAERGIRHPLLAKVVAAIRKFLREKLGISLKWTATELEALVVQAGKRLEKRSQGKKKSDKNSLYNQSKMFSRSSDTTAAYERRIDELFAGEKASPAGVKVLDKSDVLTLIGYGDKPVHVAEGKIKAGQFNHGLTAEHWKKIPQWLENPVAVFESDTVAGRLVFIAPETVRDKPVMMIVEPDADMGRTEVHLLVNAYDRGTKIPLRRWLDDGLLRYLDTKKSPAFGTTTGLQLPGVVHQPRGSNQKIYTNRDLVKLRKNEDSARPNALFSRPEKEIRDNIEKAVLSVSEEDTKSWLKQKADETWSKTGRKTIDHTRPGWLKGLTLLHLVDIGSDVLPQIKQYYQTFKDMEADRSQILADMSEKIITPWEKWARKNEAENLKLANLMNDATIAGVDPAEAYQELVSNSEYAEKRKMLEQKARDMPGEAYKYINQISEMKTLRQQESNRKKAYPELRRRWEAMPQEAKDIYVAVRDYYAQQLNETEKALKARIDRADVSQTEKRAMKDEIRLRFEGMRVQAPYFNLFRAGDYWASITRKGDWKKQYQIRKNGDEWGVFRGRGRTPVASFKDKANAVAYAQEQVQETEFYMFEDPYQQEVFAAQKRKQGYSVKTGKKLENIKTAQVASQGFVSDVIGILDKVPGGQSEQIKDAVYQLYLTTLPDASMRKRSIHRKKTLGYSNDVLRGFTYNGFHGAYQLAKLKYADIMEEQISNMAETVQNYDTADTKTDLEARKAADILSSLKKRHEWIMNPQSSGWANWITNAAFVWYLGLTPAAAIVNLFQTPVIALPVIASRYGWGNATRELMQAGRDFFSGRVSVKDGVFSASKSSRLSADEKKAFQKWLLSGILDKTLTHDLAGRSERPSELYGGKKEKAMEIISYGFHHTERLNREVTALAAYRLARKKGLSHEAAIEEGARVVNKAHYDYSTGNKAPFMQNDAAKVLLIFRQYSLNTTYLLVRNVHQMAKGESKEVRAEARKQLTGILAMQSLAAGMYGLPLWWLVASILEAFFDDEDDPWDAEVELRNWFADIAGDKVAEAITMGPLQAGSGLGTQGRLSMNDLWLRPPYRDLEMQRSVEYWMLQGIGPFGSILTSAARGKDLMAEGKIWRGIEAMTPKAIKDGMKAIRYADEGVKNLRGDPVVEELNAWEIAMQAIGFSSARVDKQYDVNSAIKGYESRIGKRRQQLITKAATALRVGDVQTYKEDVLPDIIKFNNKNPRNNIDMNAIRRSVKTRNRYSKESINGISVRKKMRYLRDRVRFGDD